MRKAWRLLTQDEKVASVAERRERRAYKTKGQIKALTVKGLAKAWNIPVSKVQQKVLQLATASDTLKSEVKQ